MCNIELDLIDLVSRVLAKAPKSYRLQPSANLTSKMRPSGKEEKQNGVSEENDIAVGDLVAPDLSKDGKSLLIRRAQ